MKKILAIAASSIILFSACTKQTETETVTETNTETAANIQIDNFAWLAGSWKLITPDGEVVETWTKQNDSVFTGYTYMLAGTDTAFTEKIRLQQNGNDVFYIPTISNENNQQPTTFRLVSQENGEFVFENKEHDFPQRIIYKQPHADTLYARIEGDQEGEFVQEEYKMAKVK